MFLLTGTTPAFPLPRHSPIVPDPIRLTPTRLADDEVKAFRADQYTVYYSFIRKARKWWRKLFFWMLEVATLLYLCFHHITRHSHSFCANKGEIQLPNHRHHLVFTWFKKFRVGTSPMTKYFHVESVNLPIIYGVSMNLN